MQVGTAVIGANSGGVVEIIDDEQTGLLFDSQNYESLAKSIEKLIHNPDLTQSIAKSGQDKCNEKFSNELQFEKLKNILKELV